MQLSHAGLSAGRQTQYISRLVYNLLWFSGQPLEFRGELIFLLASPRRSYEEAGPHTIATCPPVKCFPAISRKRPEPSSLSSRRRGRQLRKNKPRTSCTGFPDRYHTRHCCNMCPKRCWRNPTDMRRLISCGTIDTRRAQTLPQPGSARRLT